MPFSSPLSKGQTALDSYVRRVLRTCERVEDGLGARRLFVTDAELLYSSGFLSIVTRWEGFLEDSLYESVCGEAPKRLAKRRHVIVPSRRHLAKILLHPDKDYVQLATVKQASAIYDLFLKDGGPFGGISEGNRSYIQQAIWIRNAIAHSSASSSNTFRKKVPGVSALSPNKQFPGAFLRHEFRQAPSQRRLQLYSTALLSAAREMTEAWAGAS